MTVAPGVPCQWQNSPAWLARVDVDFDEMLRSRPMQGTMLLYTARGSLGEPPMRTALTAPPAVANLQRLVEGDIQRVGSFETISIDGYRRECVVYCNEDGKNLGLPPNRRATMLWHAAMKAHGLSLVQDGEFIDVIVGNAVVLYGDNEFLDAL